MRRKEQSDLPAAVETLGRRVEELEQELRRLRQPALPEPTPGWDEPDDGGLHARPVSHTWLSILEPPVRRRPRIPRLPFEILFLAACAVAAGFADLDPIWIAAVMAGAWLLVSLTEWAATLADRRRLEDSALAPPRAVPLQAELPDPSWYVPPVEQTIVQAAGTGAPTGAETATEVGSTGVAEAATAITRLRRPAGDDLEKTIEHRPPDAE